MMRTARAFERIIGRAIRWLRVGAYCSSIAAAGGAIALVSARGYAGERARDLGRELAPFADLLRGAHEVSINGETVYLASAVTRDGVRQVLDRFEAHCREHGGGLEQELDRILESRGRALLPAQASALSRLGILRHETEDEGTLVCIAQRGDGGMRGMVGRMRDVLRTGDLGRLGDIRYVYARRADNGFSHVLTSFTEGTFRFRRVIAAEGSEAPEGEDPPNAPRPPDSLRLASMRIRGEPYAAQVYQSKRPAEQIVHFYEDELKRRDWHELGGFGQPMQVWQNSGVTMFVSITPGDGAGFDASRVSLVEAGR